MKKYLLIAGLSFSLLGCGNDSVSFDGVWSGSFNKLQNNCPFSVAPNVNPLFPMTVREDSDKVFTVVAADGSTAVGGQGDGETISFLASAKVFGDFGSIAPYTCESSSSTVGYLDAGDGKALVTVTIFFTNCTSPTDTNTVPNCAAIYFGEANRI